MKKPTSRKQQLSNRSFRYAYGVTRDELHCDDPHSTRAAYSWQDGYRAAMRDLRKLVRECYADAAVHADPEKRIKMRNHCVRVRLERFLRPLR